MSRPPDPLAWIGGELDAIRSAGLERRLRVPPVGVSFGSNDYLGLANDPRLADAAHEAAIRFGWGAGASPLVRGWCEPHEALTEAIARFEHAEAALIFPTGYAANLGTVSALVESGDAVYLDRLNHSCLVEGAKLSGASVRVYPHNHTDRLRSVLKRERSRYRRVLIATDGVFSMDGDLAPLADLAGLAEEFDAMLLVDEAHGTGVFGPTGRGACEEQGVGDRVHVRVGTLSKAVGSLGGFVAGSRQLIDWLTNRARTLIYSTSLPPAVAAAGLKGLELMQAEPWRRERVRALGERVASELGRLGLDVPTLSRSPIVPVILGEPELAMRASAALERAGLFMPAIRPPTVPRGTARLRVSLSAGHSDAEVDRLIGGIKTFSGA